MKSILCVIDFSESSIQALRWSVELSQRFEAHLHVMYPYRLIEPKAGEEIIQYKKDTEEVANKRFEMIEKDHLVGKGISFDFKPEVGFLSDRIDARIRKHSLMMMVISKNVSLVNKENFNELLDKIKIPLVLVP